eukprot:CAMPEP_0197574292 /NCGR_PEP_ID=MMETSP1326-20131121/42_1 /TAXON_ID=1155430 /ORGANISM="Genus nov. species nov., Strain RCC2288" /LENGTH=262 /DNA_ID=CAMNT_0043136833 /DNA_START=482 /DNA_END=1270 /DNA_ORIENTATION=-
MPFMHASESRAFSGSSDEPNPGDGIPSNVGGSDGFLPKEESCHQEYGLCKSTRTMQICQYELCVCRMRDGVWIAKLNEDGFNLIVSFSWKEHMLDDVETWQVTRWENLGVKKPDIFIINSGIHAFHGLDPAWYFNRDGKFIPFSDRVLDQYYRNATKLRLDMTSMRPACVIWKTMNDYGSYTQHYKHRNRGVLPKKLKFQELSGQRYRMLGKRLNAIFIADVPVMDTRGLTMPNPSSDPYHHPNLQRQLALLAWHTIFVSCA